MLRTRILVLLLMAFVVTTLIAALNPDWVVVKLAFGQWRVRLGVVLGLALALGVVLGVVLRAAWLGELLRERGRLRRALKSAEARALAGQSRVDSQ